LGWPDDARIDGTAKLAIPRFERLEVFHNIIVSYFPEKSKGGVPQR
jgi:hypothetical protein